MNGAVGEAFEQLERWQPVTNAFTQVYAEDAASQGAPPAGRLSGVPVAVKDLFDIAGKETTGCSRVYEGRVATKDAELVRRLREAGAVIIGKTNMHELAMGGTNLLSSYGRTCNPWDPARITGGSSGGSAAAVASGVIRMALGTDTGGSIRNPAVLCGCWGLKPTHGVLPLDGVLPLAPSLDSPGPMAISAQDLSLLWEAMSGAPVSAGDEKPLRVGVLGGHFARGVHPDMRAAVTAVASALEGLGHTLTQADGEGIDHTVPAWIELVSYEMTQAHPILVDHPELLFPRTAELAAAGAAMTPEEIDAAYAATRETSAWFDERLEDVDLLLAPSSPYPAPLADQDEVDVGEAEMLDVQLGGTSIFTRPVNMAGLPALAIPSGRSPSGLPVGAQLIGRRGADDLLVRLAIALEDSGDARFRPQAAPFPQ